MNLPVRKSPRLKGYDYSTAGAYSLTLCSYRYQHLFGTIEQQIHENLFHFSDIGLIVRETMKELANRFPEFEIINYQIMPNHIHILVLKTDLVLPSVRTISDFVCAFKSLTWAAVNNIYPGKKVWKDSFHDHIIRNERDMSIHWDYIEQNVNRWQSDKYYPS